MSAYFIPVIVGIALIISAIMSIIFKGTSKTDKGFKINYYQLSYRRKMMRTLIFIPINILLLIFISAYTDWSVVANVLLGLSFHIALFVQLFYTFNMWKKYEK